MNNKVLGNNFEQDMCSILAQHGYWVHFITPDARGAQPFDIVCAKNKIPYAIECKTLTFSRRYFTIDRLEDNQILAFKRWTLCGNGEPIIAVKQDEHIVTFRYADLINAKKIDMKEFETHKYYEACIGNKTYKVYGVLGAMLYGTYF